MLIPREQFGNSVGFILVSHREFFGGCFCAVLLCAHTAALQPQPLRSGAQNPAHGTSCSYLGTSSGVKDQPLAGFVYELYFPCSSQQLDALPC